MCGGGHLQRSQGKYTTNVAREHVQGKLPPKSAPTKEISKVLVLALIEDAVMSQSIPMRQPKLGYDVEPHTTHNALPTSECTLHAEVLS